jgi:hypothetical protein
MWTRSTLKSFSIATALSFLAVPLLASAAEAGGNRRKSNAQMMRLGGPAEPAARRNGIMRLGGPTNGTGTGFGGFSVEATTGLERRGTCQFCSNESTRDYFLALDRNGRGGGN